MSDLHITWHPQKTGDDPLQGLRVDRIMVLRAVAANTPSHPAGTKFIGRVVTHVNGVVVKNSGQMGDVMKRAPGRATITFGGHGKASPKQKKLQHEIRSVKGPGPGQPQPPPPLPLPPQQHPSVAPKTALAAKTPVVSAGKQQPPKPPAPKTQLAPKNPISPPPSKPASGVVKQIAAPPPKTKPRPNKPKKKPFNYEREIEKLRSLNDVIEDMGSALIRYELGYIQTRCPSSHLLEPCTNGICDLCHLPGNGLGCRVCDWDICWRCTPEHTTTTSRRDNYLGGGTDYQVSLHSIPRDATHGLYSSHPSVNRRSRQR